MFKWMTSRLNRSFLAATAAGLLMSTVIFLLIFLAMYETEISRERKEAVSQVNQLLRTSLENAMLKRDLDGLRNIVSGLGQQQNIVNVIITNPHGEIRFSDSSDLLGKHLAFDPSSPEATTGFITNHNGVEVLRSINPVRNKSPCIQCHGPTDKNPINGILYVDYDAASLRRRASATTLVLMGSGALIVVVNIIGGWWFIRRFVLKPIATLSTASNALSQGNLDTRVNLPGQNELTLLGHTFNRMAENLQGKIRELSEKEKFLQSLVDAIPDGVRIIDTDFRVLLVNNSFREQFCIDESSVQKYCYECSYNRTEPCVPTLITCPVYEIVKNRQPLKVLHHHYHSDGSPREVEIYAAPLITYTDGKEQLLIVESIRDLEKTIKYSQEQKLTELGRLATGVAHEIYNPLSSVRIALHASQNALAKISTPTNDINNYLEILDKEVDNCIEVTERLLKLGAPPGAPPMLVELEPLIHETISLLHWEAQNSHINIIENYENGLRVLATDNDLRMAALNLIQNAFHAMPHGGNLLISTSGDDQCIQINIQDDGMGIDPVDFKSIFDPFFSRRADGSNGTGLGLSIARSIIKNHGGKISAISKVGEGSTFTIQLPNPDKPPGCIS
ncbi:MAG: histidine kinase [Sedimenticola sp.]|nr:MAG: histidine kinase [Sedimenticola sp.]